MMSSAKTLTVPSDILSDLRGSCLWICTAAGPQIGFGHLKRTMALARSLKDCCLPLFLISPQDRWSRENLADHGFAFFCEPLSNVWSHLPEPKAILVDTRSREGVVDFVNEAKKRHHIVISIHDLGLNPLDSDIVIDGSIAPDFSGFSQERTLFHAGTHYMILDPVYRILNQQVKVIHDRIQTVFINLGGGNSGRYFRKILEGLKLWNRDLEVVGAAGFYSWGQDSLARENWLPIRFRWCKESLGANCFKADLAITAGGLAAYEALCIGTPLLALAYDCHQKTTIRAIAKENACIDIGLGEELIPENMPAIFSSLESDREQRRILSLRGRSLVDGRGIDRTSSIIREAIAAFSYGSLMEEVG